MGQFWQFINIDKAQATDWFVKLGEIFFDPGTTFIIANIAVPANAPQDYHKPVIGKGSWVGDRIMFIGQESEKWPEKVLLSKSSETMDFENIKPCDFVNLAFKVYPFGSWKRDHLGRSYQERDDDAFPRDRTWVLRNLDKKVYVRSNGIPAVFEDDKLLRYYIEPGPFAIPGLGSVLLGRIGWSPGSFRDDEYQLTQGDWAGDRVDARLFDDVKEELLSGGWVDTSKIEALRTRALWTIQGGGKEDIIPGDSKDERQDAEQEDSTSEVDDHEDSEENEDRENEKEEKEESREHADGKA